MATEAFVSGRRVGEAMLFAAIALAASLCVRWKITQRIFAGTASDEAFPSPAAVRGEAAITNSLGMKLIWIAPGDFMMGSLDPDDDLRGDEKPHRVRITRPFYLAAHEVTVGQFRRFVEATHYRTEAERSNARREAFAAYPGLFDRTSMVTWQNPGFPQTEDHPVVRVTWHDARAFLKWLSHLEQREYRLPSEAEWEYACRAGSTTRFSVGSDDSSIRLAANVCDPSAKQAVAREGRRLGPRLTMPVGSFPANDFGLHDMHGNVWEFCADRYQPDCDADSTLTDPKGPSRGSDRVMRGGSFGTNPWFVRSANRCTVPPAFQSHDIGFRVALTPK